MTPPVISICTGQQQARNGSDNCRWCSVLGVQGADRSLERQVMMVAVAGDGEEGKKGSWGSAAANVGSFLLYRRRWGG
jgi:hypothetical protein